MFQNFIQDVLNRVDGLPIRTGNVSVVASAAAGEICRTYNTLTGTPSAIELEIDPKKNTMITFDISHIQGSTASGVNVVIAAIANGFGNTTVNLDGTVQTVIPAEFSTLNDQGVLRIKGAINVPRIAGAVSGKYSCVISFPARGGQLIGIARAHYSDFHTFQPNK